MESWCREHSFPVVQTGKVPGGLLIQEEEFCTGLEAHHPARPLTSIPTLSRKDDTASFMAGCEDSIRKQVKCKGLKHH